MAVCLVALLVPLSSEISGADDGYFYYTITNTTGSDSVISVTVTDGDGSTEPIAGDKDSDGSYTSTYTSNVGSWGFDPDTGLGPFNSFYAAFDPYHDNALVGVLDPYDLTRLVTGESIEGQTYNIMWVLPTVYWKADGNSLTLTDDPSAGGTAYAHTIYDEDGEHVYGYIAYGVYEASVQEVNGTQVLTSTSGSSPTTYYDRPTFRGYANAQDVVVDPSASTAGHAMLWNFYQWELYKYCCVAVMASWDSQGVAGNGNVYGGSFSKTGALDAAGPYAGTRGTGNDYYTSSVKVFIENAWGSVEEFVDGVVMSYQLNGLYVDQYCVPTDSTTVGDCVELVPVSLMSGYIPLYGYGSDPSSIEQAWGFPTGATGSEASGLYDFIQVWSYYDQCLTVGGYSTAGLGCGLSYVDTWLEINDYYSQGAQIQTGARMAFVFDAGEMSATLSFDAGGADGASVPGSRSSTFTIETGATFTLSESPTREGYEFLGWSRNPDATVADYEPGGPVTVWGDTTLYAVWGAIEYDFTLRYDANGGTGAPDTESATDSSETYRFQVSSAVPTRDGYEFLGWSTDPHAAEAEYHGGYGIDVEADSTVTLYAVWAEVYTTVLEYDANGGEGAPGAQSVEDTSTGDVAFTVPHEEPERDGYVFYGWSTSEGSYAAEYWPGYVVHVPAGTTLTLYAVWAHEDTAMLVFDANGGAGVPDALSMTDTSAGVHVFTVPSGVPTRSGYAFLGWAETRDAADAMYHHGSEVEVEAGTIVVLYAVWAQEYSFALNYDANGGTGAPSAQTATGTSSEDHVFKIPSTTPTRSGYEFLGWAESKNAKSPAYQPGGSVSVRCDSSVTLYAVWGQVSPSTGTFTLAFDANGGTGAPADLVYESASMGDHTFTVPSGTPTRGGYVFGGWATSSRASSGGYWPGDEVSVPFGSTTTLYAVWISDSADVHAFTLTYDANGGAGAPASVAYTGASASHTFTVSSAVPSRDGYEFLGWSTSKDAVTAQYAVGDSFAASGDATLYAVWAHEHTATLAYDANGGEGAPDAESITGTSEGTHDFTVSSVEPAREGYVFLGWSTSKDAAAAQYWSGYVVQIDAGSVVTLYAVWAHEETATLIYDANGGTGAPGSQSMTDVASGHVFTVSSVEPVREGYVFLGWSTSKDAAAAEYHHGYAVDVAGGSVVTLYAVWAHEYTATLVFDANGGDGAPEAQSMTDTVAETHAFTIPFDEPVRDGYTFLGWATSKDAHDAEYWPGEIIHVGYGTNTVLYALWAADGEVPMLGEGGGSDDWLWYAVAAVFIVLVILLIAFIAWRSRKDRSD